MRRQLVQYACSDHLLFQTTNSFIRFEKASLLTTKMKSLKKGNGGVGRTRNVGGQRGRRRRRFSMTKIWI
jgi:hypothetical protein